MRKYALLILLFSSITSISQNCDNTLSGRVTDLHDGSFLIGATLIAAGTEQAVQTDFDGNYSLELTDANATLVVSYIGYSSQEIVVAGQEKITIVLVEDASSLDEVVVVVRCL